MSDRDPIHDLLEEAARHRQIKHDLVNEMTGEIIHADACLNCLEDWPCLVTRLAAEVHHLRKQARDQTPCVCG